MSGDENLLKKKDWYIVETDKRKMKKKQNKYILKISTSQNQGRFWLARHATMID